MPTRILVCLVVAVCGLLVQPGQAAGKRCNIRETCNARLFPGAVTVLSFQSTVLAAYTTQKAPKFVVKRFVEEVTVEPRNRSVPRKVGSFGSLGNQQKVRIDKGLKM